MINQKSLSVFKTLFFAFTVVCFLAGCQDDEMLSVTENVETAAVSTESNVPSVTITGANTQFVERVECSSCTYVVDANAKVVDGEELGLKPGSVICLNAAVKYGNLSFENLEGTTENPIVIGNCK